ncbi:similar to Saccharomyces cerevisiae YHR040W BCD1 Essential protein required for the accumulation of box C/D snoRNA [Maudiozyma saulgeensis]|uniref:Similar to Saccharomyces cerevisiae YHR040W BCD1 Essential protein required for the accumulation of box C/D snoRNA n=1 Tax=Maudiozyma saulgeensis TaxID=1789683 RepID=A0A1X7R568_9SACH|nr:similar to Saccharomyces cerevisiae YHR040W BCD1 Essential protein required for the accumulation of box C/D snoRNA [Kazachstania saulgeensis]
MNDLPLCEVCHENPFKYKCPGCLKRTCSLACSKRHKLQDSCTGQAYDPKQYVSKEDIRGADDEKRESNPLVQRDFHFLTGLKRELEIQKGDAFTKNKKVLKANNFNNPYNRRPQHHQQNDNTNNAGRHIYRRGVNCLLLPRGMSRSSINRSKWEKAADMYVWSIEWIICAPTEKRREDPSIDTFKHISHRIKETASVVEGMSNSIYEKCCELFGIETESETAEKTTGQVGEESETIPNDNKKDKRKRPEVLIDNGLKFYIKWFPYNTTECSDSKELLEIEPTGKCIGEILKNRTVIEFPTIYIARDTKDLPFGLSVIDETTKTDEERGIMKSRYNNTAPITKPNENDSDDGSDNDLPEENSIKNLGQPPVVAPQQQTTQDQLVENEDSDDYDPTAAF